MSTHVHSGGAAAERGFNFQHCVAAWVAVHILAEKSASPPWDLPEDATLEWLRCETDHPVDDLLVGTSHHGLVFAQVKRNLNLSLSAGSDLASALDQFVRQFIACKSGSCDRLLDPQRDRLLLITSSESSKPIRTHLPNVLRRLQRLTPEQTLNDAAKNQPERHVLDVVREHVLRLWQNHLGGKPSDQELQELLSLIHIQVLDIGKGQTGEREAKGLLRSAVLRNPNQADQAWAKLVELCARLAAERSGATRKDLQRELLETDLDLRATRSYKNDIKRLRVHSEMTLSTLAHHAKIRLGSATIKIPRACTDALKQAAMTQSILVVGEPGAGKSVALHDFVASLHEDQKDFVFLAVDHLAARSLGELREELGLEHEFHEVIENWPGLEPAFLVIDALDAARGSQSERMIRDLIQEIIKKDSRWRVVASVRKFDLRYGVEFQYLFAGDPPTGFVDPEFQRVRHLNVPKLSDGELDQIGQQSSELQSLIERASDELRELLRVPFNVRILAELLDAGLKTEDLTPIKTQIELLDRYWLHRVVRSDGKGDVREALLREVCENMVAQRILRVDRSAISRPDTGALLDDLLSTQVLVEWQASPEGRPNRDILAFSHHVLFDYAVARLLFRGDGTKLIRRLEEDPELVIVVRPSLVLHFYHVWSASSDRRQFWELVFRVIASPRIPEVGKLIGPAVAAELAKTMTDLEPLCEALEEDDRATQDAAEQAFRHLAGALVAGTPEGAPLVGQQAGPWCELLERVSHNLRTNTAYTIKILLIKICDNPKDFTPAQLEAAGMATRQLLEFAWSQPTRDKWLVVFALQCACRTFESNPSESESLIRRAIEPSHLSRYGFEELPWLAREVTRLIPFVPILVKDIYCAAFRHQERSEESTSMGSSRILPLLSNRHQDYEMALYELAEAFPVFLKSAPEEATRTLIQVVEAYVVQRHSPESGQWHEEVFDFDGREAHLRTDYSGIWDEGKTYRHDNPIKMLDAFQQFVEDLATKKEDRSQWRRLLEIIVSENRLAVLWRRLLFIGARFPETIGRDILPLAWAQPILTGIDTTVRAGEYLKAIFPTLEPALRQRIERTILDIPNAIEADRREAAERCRNRLLGCLSPEAIVTDEARQRLEELRTQNAVPPNEPLVRLEGVRWAPYGEEEYLRDQGVPVDAEPNRKVLELVRPVKKFADKHLNSTPTIEEARSILPELHALYEVLKRREGSLRKGWIKKFFRKLHKVVPLLKHAEEKGVDLKLRDYAWGILAAACSRIAQVDGLSCNQEPGKFVKAVLLKASRHPKPVHNPQYDAQFDEHPLWGSPAPRIEAAKGLITLARHPDCATPDVLTAIEELSTDPVPAVRYQIAAYLNALYHTALELMWRIAERIAQQEQRRGVLQGLLTGPLGHLAGSDSDRVAELMKTIWDRITEGVGADRVREFCVGIFTDLYIWRNHAASRDVVHEIVSNPASYPSEASYVLGRLRKPLTHGPTDRSNPEADAARKRALDLLYLLLRSTQHSLREIEKRHASKPFEDWTKSDQKTFKSLLRLIDRIATEVYFASGAFDARRHRQKREEREVGPQSKRFYQEAGKILDKLADVALPSVAHHLLEILEYFIPLDPRGVFLRIHRVVSAGQQAGYQYESMAADLIVWLVERYLAEHRTLLQEDKDCRKALIEVLDVFVSAGWPSARRLAYRLDEIFR